MEIKHSVRFKVLEWIRRYLPCEIASTVAEFGSAAAVYMTTGSWAAAAVVATVFSSVGYYATAYINAVRWSMAEHGFGMANLLALRSIAVEFGPAEIIDSLAIRPVALYLGPVLTGNMVAGLIIGKVVADVGFYGCTILSYEKFRNLLAVKRTDRKEDIDESFDAVPVG
jgi:hypothetical protein